MQEFMFYIFTSANIVQIEEQIPEDNSKFWIIQNIYDALLNGGVSIKISNAIVFVTAFLILAGVVALINAIMGYISSAFIRKGDIDKAPKIYNILFEQKFFNRLLVLIAIVVVLFSARVVFSGFSEGWVRFVIIATRSVLVIWTLLLFSSLLDGLETFFSRHPKTQHKSLKGYVQISKIILAIIAIIIIVSTITDKDLSTLFMGFGAMAAVITLIFRDTILGFVASIHLSFQDMIRPGDWIEMPSKNADGLIVDINLSSVKVQNWDHSVTMIPIYTLITDSFTNWRRMELGPGRLFERRFHVNAESVKFADQNLLETLSKHPVTGTHFKETLALAQLSSPGDILTNLSLFRAYLELFLRRHPQINDKLMLFVRYTDTIADIGIGIEIYAFSRKKTAAGYDIIHRTVMEHVIATTSIFGITLFQKPSGIDMREIRNNGN